MKFVLYPLFSAVLAVAVTYLFGILTDAVIYTDLYVLTAVTFFVLGLIALTPLGFLVAAIVGVALVGVTLQFLKEDVAFIDNLYPFLMTLLAFVVAAAPMLEEEKPQAAAA